MKTLAIVLALIASFAAEADELTAGELYAWCKDKYDVSQTACKFYILGVVQGIELGDGSKMGSNNRLSPKKNTIFCAPDNMPVSQMIDVFTTRVRVLEQSYPQDLKLPAVGIVGAAMVNAFPCSR